MNLANKITILRLFLIPLFIIFTTNIPTYIDNFFRISFFQANAVFIATFIFIIASITDKLDGYIARKNNQVTKFGIFLDPLVDKLLVTAALIYLVQANKTSLYFALIIIGREIAVTGLRLAAVNRKMVLAADKYGKIKMVFQIVAIILTLLDNYPISRITTFPVDDALMILAVALTVVSGINYFIQNRDVFKDAPSVDAF